MAKKIPQPTVAKLISRDYDEESNQPKRKHNKTYV
jgi:hypothetical protein